MPTSDDTAIICAVPRCNRPATIVTYILRPYGGKNNVIDSYTDPTYPYLCATCAARNHLGPSFTTAAAHRGVQVYEAVTDDAVTKELLRFLPKMPAYPRRGGFAAFQRRAWAAFHGSHKRERLRRGLQSGRLKKLVTQLEVTLPEARHSNRSQAPRPTQALPEMEGQPCR